MIEELNKTVMNIESLVIGVPYISVSIDKFTGRDRAITMQVDSETFSRIAEEVDPILILKTPMNYDGFSPRIEHSILIGTVRVFALFEV